MNIHKWSWMKVIYNYTRKSLSSHPSTITVLVEIFIFLQLFF